MLQFLIKRLVGLLFVVLMVTFVTFILGYFAPGDPIQTLLGLHFNPQEYASLRHLYGLDLPWWQQYLNYLHNLFTFNFGLSFEYKNRSVVDILSSGVPISLELGFWALALQLLIGVPLGVLSAVKAGTWVDTTNTVVMLLLYALPTFIIAVFVQTFIVWLDQRTGINWPVSQWGTPWHYTWSDIEFKLAPIFVYTVTGVGYFTRLVRTTLLEMLDADFVRTARAKGLQERAVLYRHAFRNALIPLVTIIGVSIGFLVTGAFFVEDLFNIPGIANITISSITTRDYPVIQATGVLLALAVVLGNLLSDILYVLVDPRIKIE